MVWYEGVYEYLPGFGEGRMVYPGEVREATPEEKALQVFSNLELIGKMPDNVMVVQLMPRWVA